MRDQSITLAIGLLVFLFTGFASVASARTVDCAKPPYGDSPDNYQQFILNGEVASKGNLKKARAIAAAEASELTAACNAKYLHRGTAKFAAMGLSLTALKNYTVTQIAAHAMASKNKRPQKADKEHAEARQPRISTSHRVTAPPRSVTVPQFQIDGSKLASAGAHVLVSGAYIGRGDGGYLYASSVAVQTTNAAGTRVPSIRLLTRHASKRARTRFALCGADPVTAQDGCSVTIEGVATMCKERYLFGATRDVPCIDVRDAQP